MNMQRTLSHGLLFSAAALVLLAGRPEGRAQAPASGATLFEGARLIVGDGSTPIENSAFVVESARFTGIGRRGAILAPPDAVRVDLDGKTVIPPLIDTHGHLGLTREDYINQLNLLAYCGIAVTTSMGRERFRQRADRSRKMEVWSGVLSRQRHRAPRGFGTGSDIRQAPLHKPAETPGL